MAVRLDLAITAAFVLYAVGTVGFVQWREKGAHERLEREILLAQSEGLIVTDQDYQKILTFSPSKEGDVFLVFERLRLLRKRMQPSTSRLAVSEGTPRRLGINQIAEKLRRLEKVEPKEIAVCLAGNSDLLKLMKAVDGSTGLAAPLASGHVLSDVLPYVEAKNYRLALALLAESAFLAGRDAEAIEHVRRLLRMTDMLAGTKLPNGFSDSMAFRKEAIGQLCRMAGRRSVNSLFIIELERSLRGFRVPSEMEAMATVLAVDLAWVDKFNAYLSKNKQMLGAHELLQLHRSHGGLQWSIKQGKAEMIAAFREIADELKAPKPDRDRLERLERVYGLAASRAVQGDPDLWSLPWYSTDFDLAKQMRVARDLGEASLSYLKGRPVSAFKSPFDGSPLMVEKNGRQVKLKLAGQSIWIELAGTPAAGVP